MSVFCDNPNCVTCNPDDIVTKRGIRFSGDIGFEPIKEHFDTLTVTKTFSETYEVGDKVSHFLEGAGIIVRLYVQNDGNFADVVWDGHYVVSDHVPLTLLDK